MAVGAAVTLAVFVGAMGLIIFGGYFVEKEVLVLASLALAPVALISVMAGYSAWWLILFLLALFFPDGSESSAVSDGPATGE
jgi:hypothetical protein